MNSMKRLKEVREYLGLNQEEFALKIGTTRSSVANMEVGRVKVSEKTISSVCIAFGINREWLSKGIGSMFKDISIEEEIARACGRLNASDDSIFKVLFLAFSRMPQEYWDTLGNEIEKLIDEKRGK